MAFLGRLRALYNGLARDLRTNGTGDLSVEIGGAGIGAFGDAVFAQRTPLFQFDFLHNVPVQSLNQIGTTSVTATGVADTNARRLRLQTGVASDGQASFWSLKRARYRAGQSITAIFSCPFKTSAASSIQIVGMGNVESGAAVDGYFFGFDGTTFGILHRLSGADTWTAQASWNGDTCDGNGASGFDWRKDFGTPVKIQYPYLGFGDILFYVQNPQDGRWILAHIIRYSNTTETLQLGNPNLQFYAQVKNLGNTTNLTLFSGSVGAFLNGQRIYTGVSNGIDHVKSTITTETNLFTLKNATSFNGINNCGMIRLRSMFGCVDAGTAPAVFRLKFNTTLGGAPSYTPIEGTGDGGVGATLTAANSMVFYDTAGTTLTGGSMRFNALAAQDGSTGFIDLTPFDIFILPGETCTISGTCSSSSTMHAALNWHEDV